MTSAQPTALPRIHDGLDPQARQLIINLSAAGRPPINELPVADVRAGYLLMAQFAGPPQTVANISERAIEGPEGRAIRLRIYDPIAGAKTGAHPLVVFFHGGGFVIGDLDSHDAPCRALANGANAVVVSVHYALAPEAKLPAGAHDAVAATRWVAAHRAELAGPNCRLVVAGDSAGGCLSAVVCQQLRGAANVSIAHQVLIYPGTDATMSSASIAQMANQYPLANEDLHWFQSHYLKPGQDRRDPWLSPLHAADLSGLPPATVITCEFDPLRDEGKAYADAMRAAGVTVTYRCFDGMIHGAFQMAGVLRGGQEVLDYVAGSVRAVIP